MKNKKLKIESFIILVIVCVLTSSMTSFAKKHGNDNDDKKGNTLIEVTVKNVEDVKERGDLKEKEDVKVNGNVIEMLKETLVESAEKNDNVENDKLKQIAKGKNEDKITIDEKENVALVINNNKHDNNIKTENLKDEKEETKHNENVVLTDIVKAEIIDKIDETKKCTETSKEINAKTEDSEIKSILLVEAETNEAIDKSSKVENTKVEEINNKDETTKLEENHKDEKEKVNKPEIIKPEQEIKKNESVYREITEYDFGKTLSSGKYYLTRNVSSDNSSIFINGDVEIDLKGHTLIGKKMWYSTIDVNAGTLIIKNGTVVGENGYAINVCGGAKLIIESGNYYGGYNYYYDSVYGNVEYHGGKYSKMPVVYALDDKHELKDVKNVIDGREYRYEVVKKEEKKEEKREEKKETIKEEKKVDKPKKDRNLKKIEATTLSHKKYKYNVDVKISIKSLRRVYEIPDYINDSDIMDISEKNDRTAVAYVDDGCYSIYSLCDKVSFPKDSSGFFWQSQCMEYCDLSGFDFSKVETLKDFFVNCFALKEVIWPKDQVIKLKDNSSIYGMFSACRSINNVDFRTFDLKKIKYSYSAFLGCTDLEYIYVDRNKASNDWRGQKRVLKFSYSDGNVYGAELADSVDEGTYTLTSEDIKDTNTVQIVDGTTYLCYTDKVVSNKRKYSGKRSSSKEEETVENISEAIIGRNGQTTFKITIERTYDEDGKLIEKPLNYEEELKNITLGGPLSSFTKTKEDKLGPAKEDGKIVDNEVEIDENIIGYNKRINTYSTRQVDKDKVEIEVSTDNDNLTNLEDSENFLQKLIARFLAIFGLL